MSSTTIAPFASITPTKFYAGSKSGVVPIGFTLTAPEGGPLCSVSVYFSTDGGETWKPATLAGSGGRCSQGKLAASPQGTPHVYEWDSFLDGVGLDGPTAVRLRFIPRANRPGPEAVGPELISEDFVVDNGEILVKPCRAVGPAPGYRGVGWTVLRDPDGRPVREILENPPDGRKRKDFLPPHWA